MPQRFQSRALTDMTKEYYKDTIFFKNENLQSFFVCLAVGINKT